MNSIHKLLQEALLDAIFATMLLASLIAALHRADSIDNTDKAKVAGVEILQPGFNFSEKEIHQVFAFIAFLLLIGTSIVSWRLYKEHNDQAFAVQLA